MTEETAAEIEAEVGQILQGLYDAVGIEATDH